MMYNIYAIFDQKTKIFSSPVIGLNDDVMKRSFENDVNDVRSQHFKFKNDLELYCIGSFNADTAEINTINPLQLIAKGVDIPRNSNYEKDEVMNLINLMNENYNNSIKDILNIIDTKFKNVDAIDSVTMSKLDSLLEKIEKNVGDKIWKKILK